MRKIYIMLAVMVFAVVGYIAPSAAAKTVYFANGHNWSTVKCYAWYDNGGDGKQNAAWAGVTMTKSSQQYNGAYIWSYDLDDKYTNVIFNGGGDSTKATEVNGSDLADGALYYFNSNKMTIKKNGEWNNPFNGESALRIISNLSGEDWSTGKAMTGSNGVFEYPVSKVSGTKYFAFKNGSNYYIPNGTRQANATGVACKKASSHGNEQDYYYTFDSSHNYTIKCDTKTLKVYVIDNGAQGSDIPDKVYFRYSDGKDNWVYSQPTVVEGDGIFSGSVTFTKSDNYIMFSLRTSSGSSDAWPDNDRDLLGANSEGLVNLSQAYPLKPTSKACFKLPAGDYTFRVDYSDPSNPKVTFDEASAVPTQFFFRYTTSESKETGSAHDVSWVYSNPMTRDGNKFKGSINIVRENGGAVCFASQQSAGWTGSRNFGPAGALANVMAESGVAAAVAKGNTNAWLLTKGAWTFEVDFTDEANPTVTFTSLGDLSFDDHDQICTATPVFILGTMTPGGWNADATHNRMTHIAGSRYIFTVPADARWTSATGFKILEGTDLDNQPRFGGKSNITFNTPTVLTRVDGDDNNATTARNVPAGAEVLYDADSHTITISYFGDVPVSDVADGWNVKATPEHPEFYLVGDFLNNWKPNPGYRMTSTTTGAAQEVELARFVIQKDTRFAVRRYTGTNLYEQWGPQSDFKMVSASGSYNVVNTPGAAVNPQNASSRKSYIWNTGATMVSVKFNFNTRQLTVTPIIDVPNQGNFEGGVPGVPFIAFVGDNLAQYPGNKTTSGAATTSGWQDGWQAYSSNNKRYVLDGDNSELGSKDGQAVYNLVWPPRNRVDFSDKDDLYKWTSEGITFNQDASFNVKTLSKADAIAELAQNGITLSTLASQNVPDGAVWTRYNTRNVLIKGRYKLWAGWAGSYNSDNAAEWHHHLNWGIGTWEASGTHQVEPNITYFAPEATQNSGTGAGNFNFDDEKYFREFSFYAARKTDGTYAYFFVARLSAEDPVVTNNRVAGDRTRLKAIYRIQQQINTSKKLVGYKLYLSEDDGVSFPDTPVKVESFDPMSIEEFNALDEAQRSFTSEPLMQGDYRWKIVALYENDTNEYPGESPVLSIFPVNSPDLEMAMMTNKLEDGRTEYTFNVRINGSTPEGFTQTQIEQVTKYSLTVRTQDNADFVPDAYLSYTDPVDGEQMVELKDKNFVTVEINADPTDHNMPEVILYNGRVGRTYRGTLSLVGEDFAETPAAVARAYVFGPRAQLENISMNFTNSLDITDEDGFKDADLEDLRAAVNWLRGKGTIVMPAVDQESVKDRYEINYVIRYNGKDYQVQPAGYDDTALYIDYLPFEVNADGTTESQLYQFTISTKYIAQKVNTGYVFDTPFEETPRYNVTDNVFPVPGTDDTPEVMVVENIGKRFMGHNAYWYDAYVNMPLGTLPVKDGVVGVLAERKLYEGKDPVVAPMVAGGNYAFDRLSDVDPGFGSSINMRQPLPEGTAGHEHYKGMTGVSGADPEPFFATSAEGHIHQFFCLTDHNSEPAAWGAGEVSPEESGTLNFNSASNGNTDESSWYTNGMVTRKIHHVHHEARFEGFLDENSTTHKDTHDEWAFGMDEWVPGEAHLFYTYRMLTSSDDITMNVNGFSASYLTRAPRLSDTAAYADVVTGGVKPIPFAGAVKSSQSNTLTGVEDVMGDCNDADAIYYTPDGRMVGNDPAPGIYIRRVGDKAEKVYVK